MKILVIGGTGIIGTGIVEASVIKGYEVTAVCRDKNNIYKNRENVNYLLGNWNEDVFANSVLENQIFDVIIDGLVFTEKHLERNLELAKGHCSHYLYISTAGVYEQPVLNGNEESLCRVSKLKWAYSRNKRKAELYLQKHREKYSFFVTVIRPPFTYGDTRIPCAVVSRKNQWSLAERIIQDKPIVFIEDRESKHAVTHISTFANAVVDLFMNKDADGEVFHVADDNAYTWDEVIQTVADILGKKVQIIHVPLESLKRLNYELYLEVRYNKFEKLVLDNTKIKRICPDVNYKIELKKGLSNTLQYLKENNSEKSKDIEFNEMQDILALEALTMDLSQEQKEQIQCYFGKMNPDYVKILFGRKRMIYIREKKREIVMIAKKIVKILLGVY